MDNSRAEYMYDMSNSNLDVIVSGISELEDNSTENHHAAAHRGKRRKHAKISKYE